MSILLEREFPPDAVLIFGGGGQGKTLVDLLNALHVPIAGVVDARLPAGSSVLGAPVLGDDSVLATLRSRGVVRAVNAVGGIGNVDVRIRIFDLLDQHGFVFPTMVHPSVVIEPSAVLAEGVQVLPLSYIGSAARLGFGTLVNAHVVISHDCAIGRVVNLSPGALLAGGATLEDYAQVGMGATININVRVGSRARIGNGATVKTDVPAGGRVYAGTIWPPRTA